ncbi:uncharacterized protein LOC134694584 [Mytilus trossulus]|uniref:uncharacterized protein LOC134694584 n=1 Tax=Mytilus trossulus TaxID=6551 RepID=UPI003006AD96
MLSSPASSIGNNKQKLPHGCQYGFTWTQPMVKEYFNIEWVGDLSGEDVLQMGGIRTELNPVQAEYLSDLEHIITFNEVPKLGNIKSRSKHLKLVLQEMLTKVSPDSAYYKDLRKLSGHQCLLSSGRNITAFIRNMEKYVKLIEEKDELCPCGFYQDLAGRFTDMFLFVEFNPLSSVWENLKGVDVTIKPDLRLSTNKSNGLALSVNELKVNRLKIEEEDYQGPPPKKRKWSWHPNSSQDLPDSSVVKRLGPGKISFTDQVEGQHAGQLLVDLHSMKEKLTDSNNTYLMPGLVIEGTSIAMTMLVISKTHFDKIKNNEPLGEEDKGKIYFSWFYDFMMESQRSILIKLLLSLNNTSDFSSKQVTT